MHGQTAAAAAAAADRPHTPSRECQRPTPLTTRLDARHACAQVLKLSRYSSGGTLVWRTLQNSGPALGLITTFTVVLSFLVGSLIFYFEQGTFKVRGPLFVG